MHMAHNDICIKRYLPTTNSCQNYDSTKFRIDGIILRLENRISAKSRPINVTGTISGLENGTNKPFTYNDLQVPDDFVKACFQQMQTKNIFKETNTTLCSATGLNINDKTEISIQFDTESVTMVDTKLELTEMMIPCYFNETESCQVDEAQPYSMVEVAGSDNDQFSKFQTVQFVKGQYQAQDEILNFHLLFRTEFVRLLHIHKRNE